MVVYFCACRLRELSERLSTLGTNGGSPALQSFNNTPIQQVVVGPGHLAILTQVCIALQFYPNSQICCLEIDENISTFSFLQNCIYVHWFNICIWFNSVFEGYL